MLHGVLELVPDPVVIVNQAGQIVHVNALAEQLGQLNQTARAARGEAERLDAQVAETEASKARDLAALGEMSARLDLASAEG